MENTINQRFKEAFAHTGLTSNGLAVKLGMNQKTMYNYTNTDREPSFKCIVDLCRAYPEFSFDYIAYGKGELFVDNSSKNEAESNESNKKENTSSEPSLLESIYKKLIASYEEQIELLKSRCSSLEEANKRLQELANNKD